MSESRPNQTNQAGMAILAIVVLFGALFLGVGGFIWTRIRAEQARRVEEVMRMMEVQARQEAEMQNQRAEASKAALDGAKERVEESATAETP